MTRGALGVLAIMLAGCSGSSIQNEAHEAALNSLVGAWEADLSTAKDPVLSLTAAAVAQQRQWVPGRDDPLLRCIAPGMPSMISNPYPIRISAADSGLTIHYEEFASVRHIFWEAPRGEARASSTGISIAHWEGDVLEVHTNNIEPGYFNRDGLAHSAQIDVVERYDVKSGDNGGKYLNLAMRVTDPQTFTDPVEINRRWVSSPDTELLPYDCIPDTSFTPDNADLE